MPSAWIALWGVAASSSAPPASGHARPLAAMARVAALALILALAIGGTAVQGAAAAGGAISLSGVTVSVLEASGSVAGKHSVQGPDAGLRLSLDHTRTLKVGGRRPLPPPGDAQGVALFQACVDAQLCSYVMRLTK